MDKKFYKTDFIPQGLMIWYCSLTVMLWILNYFFATNFWSKDNFDILSIVKRWRFGKADLIDLQEMALFLDRMYLSCTLYSSMNDEDWERYFDAPKDEQIALLKKYIKPELHHNIQWEKRIFEDGTSLDIIDDLVNKRLKESSVQFSYNMKVESITAIIRTNQWPWVLFVLGLNRAILYNDKSKKNDWEWHVVICTWIDENNNFIIYEPIYPRPNPHYIESKRTLESMKDNWICEILMIKDNIDHQ
jgi:hypothetical protein